MSLFLKLFNTTAEYNAYTADTSNFILPNVSVAKDALTTVYYNPYVDPYAGHEYVDLDLPSGTLWATMNVGASNITDYGNYYQYGKGSAQFATTSGDSYYSGIEDPLATSADTAAQVWGGLWHMPTKTQFEELKSNTNYTNTTFDGVNVYMFRSKIDDTKYIILPKAGYYSGEGNNKGTLMYVGDYLRYWSSTPFSNNSQFTYILNFEPNRKEVSTYRKSMGCPVRGVIG